MQMQTEFELTLKQQSMVEARQTAMEATANTMTIIDEATQRATQVTDVAVAGAMAIVTSAMHAVCRALNECDSLEDFQHVRSELSKQEQVDA